jgi:hypothetical protein
MRAAIFRSLLVFLSLLLPAAVTQAADSTRKIETVKDADYFGFDLRTVQNVTLDQCGKACVDDTACKAFTYNTKAKWCFLKSDFNKINPFVGAVAGKIVSAPAERDLGAAPAPTFLTSQQIADATNFKTNLEAAAGQEDMTKDTLLASARKDVAAGSIDSALVTFQSALALTPDDIDLWEEVATAAARATDNSDASQKGQNAAIEAYYLSRTASVRAQALAVMAKSLEMTQNYRAGLNAYKASLKLKDDKTVAAAYQDLRDRQGFRVTGNTIDSDSATPRACVQFSENLLKTVDYNSYVTLDGAAPKALEAKGQQICVEGLTFGQHYKMSLRQGLPSSVDEPMQKQVDLDLYVRDRSPSVRFTGDSFVLPGSARHGIPLVSVNTDAATLKLYRIGDRNLTSVLADSQFLSQIDGYRSSQIESTEGELVWQGSIDIKTELNKDVTTSFPVDEALPTRKPGVYVLTAIAAQGAANDWDTKATQWFVVSDLGVSTYAGTDGLNVFVRSLASAKPLKNISLQLIAKNNEILGTATTDENGHAIIPPGLMRGTAAMTPGVIIARDGDKDFVFLDMTRAGFDLSDRGVTGRTAPGAIDVMAWTERGIYRAGETVHVSALARDIAGKAIDRLPLTFVFLRPDGVEDRRIVSDAGKLGGYTLDLPLQTTAMRGTWTMQVYTDPKQASIGEKQFLVDDFVPDRVEFDLTTDAKDISPGKPAKVAVDGRFLYGAPAAGLNLEGEVSVKPSHQRDAYKGYLFGLADEEQQEATTVSLDGLDPLDENGKSTVTVNLADLPSTTQFLDAKVTIRMSEAGGRAVERNITLPVRANGPMIGIKPEFDGDLPENSVGKFHVMAIDPDGHNMEMKGLMWKLMEVRQEYQWYRDGTAWNYETVNTTKLISSGTVDAGIDGADISAAVAWGRYRLEVESPVADGPTSSVEFDAGWYVSATSTDTPDGLEIALDKDSYHVGDVAKLKISPRFAGEALVNIGTESVLKTVTASIVKGGGEIDIPVTADWGTGAYVTATLFRPGDDQQSHMPMRAIGVKWLKVDPADAKLDIALAAPDKTEPRKPLVIDIAVKGAGAGEEAYVTLAAVDVGILNLTAYQPADPEDWYFGQKALGLEIRDLYGRLIDGSLGDTGKLRTGGDGAETALQGSPPKEKLVAFFSGIVKLDAAGKAHVSFDIPQFNGTARLMAVAWSKAGVGHAVKDVIIRDPVVITASLPKFLTPDDKTQLRLDIANTDAPAGDYKVAISSNAMVKVASEKAIGTIHLDAGGKSAMTIPLTGGIPGAGEITVALSGPAGLSLSQSLDIPVRPSTLPITERRLVKIDPGRSLLLDDQLLAGSIMQGASVSLNLTRSPAFDIPALLMELDRYPYGCAEQTTSRALPLLYLSELAAQSGIPDDGEVHKRVQDAIYRVLSYQSSSGSFGLWGPGEGDLWLDAYVTDFLTRAREMKYDVPETAMVSALNNLVNGVGYDNNVADRGNQMAYALYVLARNRKAAISDLRYFADTMLEQFPTQLAKAHLAAALSLYGDVERSERIFAEAARMSGLLVNVSLDRSDYGSALRDDAAILALAAEARPQPAVVPEMTKLVAKEWEKSTWLSTQEQTWLVLAARGLKDADQDIRVAVNGDLKAGGFRTSMTGEQLLGHPINMVNQANDPVTAVITSIASPKDPLTAGGNGFSISRAYYTLDGEEANISDVKQNERYVVVLTVKALNDWSSRLMVTDLLPAGLEIDNPALVNSANSSNFDFLPEIQPAHIEYRYDRFMAALDHAPGDGTDFTLAYVVRAVTPGVYTQAAATVEDMYRPDMSAHTATGKMEVSAAK